MISLEWYLVLASALFCMGIYAVLSRRNAVAILMGAELMLNAVIINLVAFWRYRAPTAETGLAFALFVFAVAAAEAAVGLAIVIAVWRIQDTVILEDIDLLQG